MRWKAKIVIAMNLQFNDFNLKLFTKSLLYGFILVPADLCKLYKLFFAGSHL